MQVDEDCVVWEDDDLTDPPPFLVLPQFEIWGRETILSTPSPKTA
jgi:hypothetical protein